MAGPSHRPGPSRRGADRAAAPLRDAYATLRDTALAQLGVGPGGRLDPVRVAATLALGAAVLAGASSPGRAGGVVAAVLVGLAAGVRALPSLRPAGLTAVAAVAAVPGVVAVAARPDDALLVLPALVAAYLGLCARPGDTLRALPLLAGSTLVALGGHRPALLAGQVVLWLLAGEVAARARHGTQVQLRESRRAAETDALTGLGNRRRLDRAFAALPEGGVVVVVDLDHFKSYNDRWGHLAGDRLLARFAAVLLDVAGPGDAVCRYGGEEFVLVVPEPADAATLFFRLRHAWEQSAPVVTFSAGLAARRGGEPAEDTLARADGALYEAKTGGRNREVGPHLVPRQRSAADARPASRPA